MRRALFLPLLLAAAACGGEKADPKASGTPEYQKWKGSQVSIPPIGFTSKETGSIEVIPAEERITGPDAFCEVYVNGDPLFRFSTAKLPDGTWPEVKQAPVTFRTGSNLVDLWDSSTNRRYRMLMDTRQGTVLVFTPTEHGYEMKQTVR